MSITAEQFHSESGQTVFLDGETVTVDQLVEAAASHAQVETFPAQEERVQASRDLLDEFVRSGRTIYGVTTAVGGFVNWLIPEHLAEKLQNNILRGVTNPPRAAPARPASAMRPRAARRGIRRQGSRSG